MVCIAMHENGLHTLSRFDTLCTEWYTCPMTSYRGAMETEFNAFIAEATIPDMRGRVRAFLLYEAYVAWTSQENSPYGPMTEAMFGRIGSDLMVKRKLPGGYAYLGIRLI